MVVVALEPTIRFMDRCGMGTSTRNVAMRLWNSKLPVRDPAQLVRELYAVENKDKSEPSGSQDMAGIIYPGINRLDYDASFEGGYFPVHVESNNDPDLAAWLEEVIHILPVAQRPDGYSPLGIKNLDPDWICRLGRSGRDCYQAILSKDLTGLGEAMNESMRCWEVILPHTVHHPALKVDLLELLTYYQDRYAGAMYSGCGGGYLFVVSDEPVPGATHAKIRVAQNVGQP
jgi:galactokinase/mevalonate kinase-like predicted kinase